MKSILVGMTVPLVLLLPACLEVPEAVAARPESGDAVDACLIRLKALVAKCGESASQDELGAGWRDIDSVLAEMTRNGMIEYRNHLLIPEWDMDEAPISLVWANNYHPRIDVCDLNGDSRLDLIISATESRRFLTPYYYLVYLNAGRRLDLALQYQTNVANEANRNRTPYTLKWNAATKAYDFCVFRDELVDFYARTFRMNSVTFSLGKDGKYRKGE